MDARESSVIEQGEVYWAATKQGEKRHRYIVVSDEKFNRGKYCTVVPTTSHKFHERSRLDSCVVFNKGAFACFDDNCVAQCEAIVTVKKQALLLTRGRIGVISGAKTEELIAAVGRIMKAKCTPKRL